jgi:antirestriction protein ArdC
MSLYLTPLNGHELEEKAMASQSDIRQEITDQIVAALKKGVAPWRQPWVNHENAGLPTNVISKKRYQGVNSILLGLMSLDQGYESKFWATYRQWKLLGGSVRRGEMGSRIIFYKPLKRQQMNADGSTQDVTIPLMKTFVVFNSQQTTMDEYKVQNAEDIRPDCSDAYTKAETVIANTQADIRHGDRACYYPQHDFIEMPHRIRFTNESEYFETLFHELCHWSEHRLNWTDSFAMNELVAEMGSCFISKELRIPQSDDFLENHTAYVASWLTKLESDPKFIFRASTAASKASDFILAFKNKTAVVHEFDDVPF